MMIVVYALIGISLFFALAGVVGMMQSSTNITTLGILGVIIAGILYSVFSLHDTAMAIKLGVLGAFYLITSPITGHALGRAAYASKAVKPEDLNCDQLKEDLEDE